ncbi:MAG TPA: hypothetical protein VFH02_12320 [Jiangellaceae bacterium]|jgi:hypothetical protein|nr:hypothetical protein [Jiangellaceae bacterium]
MGSVDAEMVEQADGIAAWSAIVVGPGGRELPAKPRRWWLISSNDSRASWPPNGRIPSG